jgi:hypothetical protein
MFALKNGTKDFKKLMKMLVEVANATVKDWTRQRQKTGSG